MDELLAPGLSPDLVLGSSPNHHLIDYEDNNRLLLNKRANIFDGDKSDNLLFGGLKSRVSFQDLDHDFLLEEVSHDTFGLQDNLEMTELPTEIFPPNDLINDAVMDEGIVAQGDIRRTRSRRASTYGIYGNVPAWFGGGCLSPAMRTLGTIHLGQQVLLGRVSWGTALIVNIGIAPIFGAPTLLSGPCR